MSNVKRSSWSLSSAPAPVKAPEKKLMFSFNAVPPPEPVQKAKLTKFDLHAILLVKRKQMRQLNGAKKSINVLGSQLNEAADRLNSIKAILEHC